MSKIDTKLLIPLKPKGLPTWNTSSIVGYPNTFWRGSGPSCLAPVMMTLGPKRLLADPFRVVRLEVSKQQSVSIRDCGAIESSREFY